jgi:hypothetical protein
VTTDPNRKMEQDGYSRKSTLTEGYVRKGGSNTANSQIRNRPAAPAPMRQGTGQTAPTEGRSDKKGE